MRQLTFRSNFLVLIGLVGLACATTTSASPEERAEVIKASVLRVFLADGWQLVQESHSQLVLERRMAGFGAFAFQALTTGANGSAPVGRYTVTFVPETDHFTRVYQTLVLTSKNAFGQETTVPSKSAKDKDYIDGKLAAASATLPARYRFRASDDSTVKGQKKK